MKSMGIVEEHAAAAETDFIIYTGGFCPFCTAVKRFLPNKGMTFSEFNMDEIEGLRQQIVSETGHRTVPVVIDVRNEQPIFIGGFDETQVYLR